MRVARLLGTEEGSASGGRSQGRLPLVARIGGLGVSAIFAYIAVRAVDFDEVSHSIATNDYRWLAPALALIAVGMVVRIYRWRLLFSPETRPPVGPAASALLIGAFFNNVLPARAGEVARVLALRQSAGTPRFEALGTVIAERVYDVLSLLVLLFVAVPVLPELAWLRAAALAAAGAAVLVLVFLGLLVTFGDRPAKLALRPLAYIPAFSRERTDVGAANLVRGLTAGRRTKALAAAAALTFASWLLFAVAYWLVMLGFELDLDPFAGLLVLVATNIAMVLPSSPAALGVFEGATLIALAAYSVPPSEALSYAVVLHLVNFVPQVGPGYVALHRHTAALARRV